MQPLQMCVGRDDANGEILQDGVRGGGDRLRTRDGDVVQQ